MRLLRGRRPWRGARPSAPAQAQRGAARLRARRHRRRLAGGAGAARARSWTSSPPPRWSLTASGDDRELALEAIGRGAWEVLSLQLPVADAAFRPRARRGADRVGARAPPPADGRCRGTAARAAGPKPGDAPGLPAGPAGRPDRCQRGPHRGERYRQGGRGPSAARGEQPRRAALRGDQLRGDPRDPLGVGAVRLRARGLHRRGQADPGPHRGRGWRHTVSGRDRRPAA